MCKKLFTLCQLQLDSIINDLEVSSDGVNAAAGKMLQGFMRYKDFVNKPDAGNLSATFVDMAGSEIRSIIMGLQFHDELKQRLQHVQALLTLLEEQRSEPEQQADNGVLLEKLIDIFSSNAEFNQLRRVFPGCHVVSSAEAVELF